MCGIAGLIHRGKSSKVGHELQGMLQALKHRGEDSTGYALYGDTDGKNLKTEVPYSLENAEILVGQSQEFDTWLNEVVFDLDNFRTERKGTTMEETD